MIFWVLKCWISIKTKEKYDPTFQAYNSKLTLYLYGNHYTEEANEEIEWIGRRDWL